MSFHLDPYHPNCVRYVDYLLAGNRIKREYYGACKLVTEYFQYGSVVRRTYHNQDGSIAFEELKLGGSWLYKLGPEILTNHTEVMRRFLSKLSLKEGDLILLDRASRMDFARPLLEKDNSSKLAMVFHSEHELKMASSTMSTIMCSSMPNASITSSRRRNFKKKSWSRHLPNKDAKEFRSIVFQWGI